MKLVLKQRLFSWFDSYDVCDEYGNAVFSVKADSHGVTCWRYTTTWETRSAC